MSFAKTISDDKGNFSNFIPIIKVIGVGGAGSNAVANIMHLDGVDCAVANTDVQSLILSPCKKKIQLGKDLTGGLGAGSLPETGEKAALESRDEIVSYLSGTSMLFLTAGMGGGTGTGATPIIAKIAKEMGILTVAVVTKPFNFEGTYRMNTAESGILELRKSVDTIIVMANQKLFRMVNDTTSFTEAFRMADEVLYYGIKSITDLITMPGLINLDFADIKTIMSNMGYAMMGSGEASGEGRATAALEMAITNPLLENTSLNGARGVTVNVTGGKDMTLFEVNDVVSGINEKLDQKTMLIFGAIYDEKMEGRISVSVVATGVNGDEGDDNRNHVQTPSRTDKSPPVQQKRMIQSMIQQNNDQKKVKNDDIEVEEQERYVPEKSVSGSALGTKIPDFVSHASSSNPRQMNTQTIESDSAYNSELNHSRSQVKQNEHEATDSQDNFDIENDMIDAYGQPFNDNVSYSRSASLSTLRRSASDELDESWTAYDEDYDSQSTIDSFVNDGGDDNSSDNGGYDYKSDARTKRNITEDLDMTSHQNHRGEGGLFGKMSSIIKGRK